MRSIQQGCSGFEKVVVVIAVLDTDSQSKYYRIASSIDGNKREGDICGCTDVAWPYEDGSSFQ